MTIRGMPDDTSESTSTTSETESEEPPPSLSPAPTQDIPPHLYRDHPSTPLSDCPPDIVNQLEPPVIQTRLTQDPLPSKLRKMSDNGPSPVLAIRPPLDRPPPLDPLVASSPPRNERWVSMNKNVLQDIFETTLKDHISESDVPSPRFVSRRRLSSPAYIRRESDVSDGEIDSYSDIRHKVSAPRPSPMPPRSQVRASPDPLRGFQSTTCPPNSLFPPHGGSRQLREHNGSSSSMVGSRPGERGRFVVVPDDPAIELLRERSLLAVCGYVSESRYKAVSRALPAALTGQRWYPPALNHTHGPPFGFFHTAAVGLTRASDDMVIIGPRRVSARRGSVGNHQPTQKLRADCSNHHNLFGPHLTMTEEDLGKERDQNMANTNLGYHSQILLDEKRNTFNKGNKSYKVVDSETDVFRGDKSYTMDNRNSLRCENNYKKKPRQNKCKEKQHWFGISKAAIEGILDELVVSSISSDDSGSDSRSHTPQSEGQSGDSDIVATSPKPTNTGSKIKQTVCDNKIENKATSAQTISSSSTSSTLKASCIEDNDRPLSPEESSRTVTPVSPEKGTERVQDNQSPPHSGSKSPRSGNNQISYQDPSVSQLSSHGETNAPSQHLPSTNRPVLSSNSNRDSKEPEKEVKCPSESLPSKGWVVLNKPLISSMMEEAFNRESSSLPESPKRCESSDDSELHIVDVESVPSPESQNNNNKKENKASEENQRSYTQKQLDGRATALLLGALCMEERVPPQQGPSRAHKRPHGCDRSGEPRNKAQCNDHENKGIDLRIGRRKSTDERSSMGLNSLYEDMPPPARLQHLYDRSLAYRGMMTSQHLLAQAQSDHIHRNMANLASTNSSREVICLDSVDSGNHESGVYKNSSVLGLSADQDNRHHMERAINLATKQSAHTMPNAPHQRPINYTKGEGNVSPECCVVDVVNISREKSKGQTPDLSANPQQMSAMVAEAIKVGACMPPPSAKSRPSAAGKRSNKNGSSKSRKEPRHGWVVVSKDEVHTIMDSLTSQLILQSGADDTAASKDDSIVNKENVLAEKAQAVTGRDPSEKQSPASPSLSPKQSAKFEMVSTQHFDNSENQVVVDNCSPDPDKTSSTPEEFSGPTQDEEFRRTAIDALNAVYRHEDCLESVHLTEQSSQKEIVSLSSDSADVNSRDSVSSPLSVDQPGTSDHLAITTIIREHPVRQIIDEVDVVTLEPKSHSAPTSPIGSQDPEQTFIPDDSNAKKGFKWKSSILQRVRYDQPEDSMSSCSLSSSPASSPSAASSPESCVRSVSADKSKRRSLSANRNKTKRGNKKR